MSRLVPEGCLRIQVLSTGPQVNPQGDVLPRTRKLKFFSLSILEGRMLNIYGILISLFHLTDLYPFKRTFRIMIFSVFNVSFDIPLQLTQGMSMTFKCSNFSLD